MFTKKDDEKWYLYNYGGSLVKELKLPENAEPENKVGDDRIWAVAYENDERITYLLDSDGNIIKSYDFMNSGDINHYIYNYDEASLIKIIYGRKMMKIMSQMTKCLLMQEPAKLYVMMEQKFI